MKKRVLFLVLFVLIASAAFSQKAEAKNGPGFFLIPILETVFSGELRWRPNWPQDLPVDAFYVSKKYSSIRLSNDDVVFSVGRDSKGRLVEFPYFSADGYAEVQAVYSEIGALQTMTVTLKNYANTSKSDSKSKSVQGEKKTVKIEFPAGFLPYSGLSPGGSFPPIKVTSDEEAYHLFIFESSSFLTETWYDGEGNIIVFCKALVNRGFGGEWRVTSLQVYDAESVNFIDYHFEAAGNISEASFVINNEEETFSALYRDARPVFWKTPNLQFELQWDTKGLLTVVKAAGEDGEFGAEYRYDYETDGSGCWIKREETAFGGTNLLVPQPSLSRGVWNRRIVYRD